MYSYKVLAACSLLCTTTNLMAHPLDGPHDLQHGQALIPQFKTHTDDNYRYIDTNGIPQHATGSFPNAYNPHRIYAQHYQVRLPLATQPSEHITPLHRMPFGIALNGVLFDPSTAEFWQNDPQWRYEAIGGSLNLGLDQHNAHVQANGAYHYHGLPTQLARDMAGRHSRLLGYAADGLPIYSQYGYRDPQDTKSAIDKLHPSYQLKQGQRQHGPRGEYDGSFTQDYHYVAGSGDLDECNGRVAITPEYPQGTYVYYLSDAFPYIPRCLKGKPEPSFLGLKGRPPVAAGQMRPNIPGFRSPPALR